jgi:hypothetical protein
MNRNKCHICVIYMNQTISLLQAHSGTENAPTSGITIYFPAARLRNCISLVTPETSNNSSIWTLGYREHHTMVLALVAAEV